jgi:hypothetical protein
MTHGWHHYARLLQWDGERLGGSACSCRPDSTENDETLVATGAKEPARTLGTEGVAPATATTSLIAFRASSEPDKLTALNYQTSVSRDTMSSCYLRRHRARCAHGAWVLSR